MKDRLARWHRIAFWAIFLAIGTMIGLSYAGFAIPKSIFYLVWISGFVFGLVVLLLNMQSATRARQSSAHPDQDIAALIEGKIDIDEYRKRKGQHDA